MKERAFTWLQEGFEQRSPSMIYLAFDMNFLPTCTLTHASGTCSAARTEHPARVPERIQRRAAVWFPFICARLQEP